MQCSHTHSRVRFCRLELIEKTKGKKMANKIYLWKRMNRIYRNEMRNISTKFECHNKRSSYKSEKLAIIEKYASSEIRCSGVHSPRNVAMTYIHIFNPLFRRIKSDCPTDTKKGTNYSHNIQHTRAFWMEIRCQGGWIYRPDERKPEGEFPCT